MRALRAAIFQAKGHRRHNSMFARLARDSVQATLGSLPQYPSIDAENWLLDGSVAVAAHSRAVLARPWR